MTDLQRRPYHWESPPSDLCGSLRVHDEHLWTGQTTGLVLLCPGRPGRAEELRSRADDWYGDES